MPTFIFVTPLQTFTQELTTIAPRRTLPDWTVGDSAHKAGVSDHNIDDTLGWRTEQTDSDSIPEVRGVDIRLPLNASFTPEQLVQWLIKQSRAGKLPWLRYVIYKRRIWTRSGGWVTQRYNGSNPHNEHIHVSSLASRDNDSTSARLSGLLDGSTSMEDWMFCSFGDKGNAVKYLQYRLHNLGFNVGEAGVDGDYGASTAAALARAVKSFNDSIIDGKIFGPAQMIFLDILWIRQYGADNSVTPGPPGPPGPVSPIDYERLAEAILNQLVHTNQDSE